MREYLRVVNLSKTFAKKEVVTDATFTIDQGTTLALLGGNGAGKSTVIHMITTLLKKSGGKIIIDGNDIDIDRDAIKKLLGVVFQEDVLDKELTVYQNLYFRGGFYTKTDKQLKARIHEVMASLHMEHIINDSYKTLSGGQKRIVQIARTLLARPKLLLLDEPTAGLDPYAREQVWKTIKKIQKEQNMTIFYTTHYLEETHYATKIGVIKDGKITLYDPKAFRLD